jgi:hypothetical protein
MRRQVSDRTPEDLLKEIEELKSKLAAAEEKLKPRKFKPCAEVVFIPKEEILAASMDSDDHKEE